MLLFGVQFVGPRQAESVSNLMPGSKTQCPVCVASFGALGKHIHVVQDHDCGCSLMVTDKHIQCQNWEQLSSVGVPFFVKFWSHRQAG